MKVAFDIKNLWLYGKGIGTFTVNLLKDLSNCPAEGNTIQLFAPSFDMDSIEFIHQNPLFQKIETPVFDKRGKFSKVKYDQYSFLRSLQMARPDLLFSPYFDIPVLWRKPLITTIHDLSIFDQKDNYGRGYYYYSRIMLNRAVLSSSFIVTVSEYSKTMLIEKLKIPEHKIRVIYNKAPLSFTSFDEAKSDVDESVFKEKLGLPASYILYTGGFESRKNIDLLIQGVVNARKTNRSIPKLVITGVSSGNVPEKYSAIPGFEDIILPGFLPYEKMTSLYRFADLIVNTSGYEGFGIPILEALTMKKTMLCSDIPVYREIGKDSVYYFKNNDQKSFEDQLGLFFTGKLPGIDVNKMALAAAFYNDQNYSGLFFQMIKDSL